MQPDGFIRSLCVADMLIAQMYVPYAMQVQLLSFFLSLSQPRAAQ